MKSAQNDSDSEVEVSTRRVVPGWLFALLISIIAVWCLGLVRMMHHARLDWRRNVDLISELHTIGSDIEKLSFQDSALTPASVRSLSHRFLSAVRSIGVAHPDVEKIEREVRTALRDALVTLELVARNDGTWSAVKERVQGLNGHVNALLSQLRAEDDRLAANLESETRSFYILGAVSTALAVLNLIFLAAYRRRQDKITQALLARRRMHNLLLIAERMASVGTLAAGVGHEINNPLAYVIVNLDMLLPLAERVATGLPISETDGKEMVELVNEVKEGAIRIRNIVSDLKSFSRTETTPAGPVDVTRVVDLSTRMASIEIRHRARIVRNLEKLPSVRAEEGRLGQVFLNLLVNAAQAIREGNVGENEIRISGRTDGEQVLIEIQDTGVGIPRENLEKIFDPFFTTKPVGQGTGLGLAFCHNAVSQMGGNISVSSEPGKGSTFVVSLPTFKGEVSATSDAGEASRTKRNASSRGKVLVIDDEPLVAKTVERLLGKHHDVVILTAARQSLQLFEEGRTDWDAILIDLTMPEMSGIDLHHEIVARFPYLADAVVFISGGVFTSAAQDYLAQNTVPLLTKPFETAVLSKLIDDRIRSRGQIVPIQRSLATEQITGSELVNMFEPRVVKVL